MKPQSVKSAAEQLEPVKKYVEACWNSPKRYHVFCLVEGELDKRIYETRLNDKMNITAIYDQQAKTFVPDAKSTLQSIYVCKVDMEACAADIDTFVASMDLANYSPYDICRGHDVIGLLEFVYGNAYSKSAMEQNMKTYYSKADFYNTSLFAAIQQYCQTFGIDAKV